MCVCIRPVWHPGFFLIPTKSSQLLHPSFYSPNTHTCMLASSTIDFGIHCCHGNGIEHALSHRLFFSIALCLCSVEANQLLVLSDRRLFFSCHSRFPDVCLFICFYQMIYHHSYTESMFIWEMPLFRSIPLVSRLVSRSLIQSILCTPLSIFSSLPLNFSSLSLIFSLSFSHSLSSALYFPPSSFRPSPSIAKMTAMTIQWEEKTPSEASPARWEEVLKVKRGKKQKKTRRKEKKRKIEGIRREGEAEVQGRGQGGKVKDKRWMEAAGTGATDRSSQTKKKNSSSSSSSSGGERRWRRKAETCPQVTHTHTYAHTQKHTCMRFYMHKQQTTRCTWECIHETYVLLCRYSNKHTDKHEQTKYRKPPIHTHTQGCYKYRGLDSEVVLTN